MSPRRPAFTLLELLLVIAIMAAIAAVAIPQASVLLGDRRIVRSGEQVRIEMTHLRVKAMREGRVMMLQGQLDGNSIRTQPFHSLSDSVEALDQTGSQIGLLSGAQQGVSVAQVVDESEGKTISLPDQVKIEAVATVSAARSLPIEQQSMSEQAGGWSRPILFYPDGTTSTAAVRLSHETDGHVTVSLRGITGDATVSEVMP